VQWLGDGGLNIGQSRLVIIIKVRKSTMGFPSGSFFLFLYFVSSLLSKIVPHGMVARLTCGVF
jgi:hypothetical protein